MILNRPTGKQAASILESDARLNIWEGSVRSGKTIGSLIRWLEFVARNEPAGELLMAGKTERTLKRNVLDPIGEMVGGDLKVISGAGEARLFGRRIYLAGGADERSEAKLRGLTLAGIYADEVTTWPQSFFQMALTRISVRNAKLFGTTNPDGPRHWLKKDYLDKAADLGLKRFHFVLSDNPSLDPAYVAALKQEFTGLWYRRFVLGEWVQAEGAIFDCWDQDEMVVAEVPKPLSDAEIEQGKAPRRIVRQWVSIDYGTANPFVALLFGLDSDNNVYVMSEYRWDSHKEHRQKTDSEYSEAVRDWIRFNGANAEWVYVDPSAASFSQQLWRDGISGVRHANNDVLDGIRITATALAQGRLKVHRSCEGLIDEIPGYVWDPDQQEKGLDRPIKVDDHSVDALRYGIASSAHMWGRLMVMEAA